MRVRHLTPSKHQSKGNAFTIIELLIVMGCISILVSLLLPAVQQTRAVASRIACGNKIRNVAFATLSYADLHGALPPGVTSGGTNVDYSYMTWLCRILPGVEQSSLWDSTVAAYSQTRDPFGTPQHVGFAKALTIYSCPDDSRTRNPVDSGVYGPVGLTSYIGNGGTNYLKKDGVFFVDSKVRLADITDGTSNTLLLGERPPSTDLQYGWWYTGLGQDGHGSPDMFVGVRELNIGWFGNELCDAGPYSFTAGDFRRQCDLFHFWSPHDGGAWFARCDGSAAFLSYSVNEIMPALATRSGGEP